MRPTSLAFSSLLIIACSCGGRAAGDLDPSGSPSPSPSSSTPPSGGAPDVHATVATSGVAIDTTVPGDFDVMAQDATDLFLAGMDGIIRVSKSGGAPITLRDEVGVKEGIATDGTYVYFTRYTEGEVLRMPAGGGPIDVLANAQIHPSGIAIDEGWVYWVCVGVGKSTGRIMRRPLGGGADPTVLVDGEASPVSLTLDDSWVYFVDAAAGGGTIRRVAKDGSAAETIADKRAVVGGPSIAVASGMVAWSENDVFSLASVHGGVIAALGPDQSHAFGASRALTSVGRYFDYVSSAGSASEVSEYDVGTTKSRTLGRRTPTLGEATKAIIADTARVFWLETRSGAPATSGVHSVPR